MIIQAMFQDGKYQKSGLSEPNESSDSGESIPASGEAETNLATSFEIELLRSQIIEKLELAEEKSDLIQTALENMDPVKPIRSLEETSKWNETYAALMDAFIVINATLGEVRKSIDQNGYHPRLLNLFEIMQGMLQTTINHQTVLNNYLARQLILERSINRGE